MDTEQIYEILKNQLQFQGVFSANNLPARPGILICNTDPSHKPGTHWIVICVTEEGYGEYFDSFGRKPNKHFERYMNENCRRWIFNGKQLQSRISAFCGFYCCVVVILKCRNISMRKIISMFTNDTGYNDWIVHRFLCK